MRLLRLFALLATLTTAAAAAAQADPGPSWGPETPNFNLEVLLRPTVGGPDDGFGLVKFRQPNDENTIVYLDVWVRDLLPNHSYYLERAVDATVNDDCSGNMWLTLGQGPAVQAITTDDSGTGRAGLWRTVPPSGRFDIHFRVIDPATSPAAVVLQSGCYQFTISR